MKQGITWSPLIEDLANLESLVLGLGLVAGPGEDRLHVCEQLTPNDAAAELFARLGQRRSIRFRWWGGDDVRHEKDQHRSASEGKTARREIRFQKRSPHHGRIDPHAKKKEAAHEEEPQIAPLLQLASKFPHIFRQFLQAIGALRLFAGRGRKLVAKLACLAEWCGLVDLVRLVNLRFQTSRQPDREVLHLATVRDQQQPRREQDQTDQIQVPHAPEAAKLEVDGDHDQRREVNPRRWHSSDIRTGSPAFGGSNL